MARGVYYRQLSIAIAPIVLLAENRATEMDEEVSASGPSTGKYEEIK